jgi:hypothetical protein
MRSLSSLTKAHPPKARVAKPRAIAPVITDTDSVDHRETAKHPAIKEAIDWLLFLAIVVAVLVVLGWAAGY